MASYTWPPSGSGSGGGVTSLNDLIGALTLVAGTGITVTPSGSTITIASTGLGTVYAPFTVYNPIPMYPVFNVDTSGNVTASGTFNNVTLIPGGGVNSSGIGTTNAELVFYTYDSIQTVNTDVVSYNSNDYLGYRSQRGYAAPFLGITTAGQNIGYTSNILMMTPAAAGVVLANSTWTLATNGGTGAGTTAIVVDTSQNTTFSGQIDSSVAKTTLTGTAGTATCSQPFAGASYKKVIVYLSGYTDTGTQTYTFPVAFTHTPYVYGLAGGVTGATVSTTTVTFTTTTLSGFVFIEGF